MASFSLSVRGIELGVTQEDVERFFKSVGTVSSVKCAGPAAYVNYSAGDIAAAVALNGSTPEWNKGKPLSVRQQAAHVAKIVAEVQSIAFSVSVRGIHSGIGESAVAAAFGKVGKVHSLKLTNHVPTCGAFINFSSGEAASILAMDRTAPAWNRGATITVREQDLAIARKAATKPIGSALAPPPGALKPPLLSKKRQEQLTVGEDSGGEDEEKAGTEKRVCVHARAAQLEQAEAAFVKQQASAAKCSDCAETFATSIALERHRARGCAPAKAPAPQKRQRGDEISTKGGAGASAKVPNAGAAVVGLMTASKRRQVQGQGDVVAEGGLMSASKRREAEAAAAAAAAAAASTVKGAKQKGAKQTGGQRGGDAKAGAHGKGARGNSVAGRLGLTVLGGGGAGRKDATRAEVKEGAGGKGKAAAAAGGKGDAKRGMEEMQKAVDVVPKKIKLMKEVEVTSKKIKLGGSRSAEAEKGREIVPEVNVEAQESLQPDAETVEDADGAEELEFDADEGEEEEGEGMSLEELEKYANSLE